MIKRMASKILGSYRGCQVPAKILRHEFTNFGQNIVFTLGENLQRILCKNKSKLLPNNNPGVYQLDCAFNVKYIGETKKDIALNIQKKV